MSEFRVRTRVSKIMEAHATTGRKLSTKEDVLAARHLFSSLHHLEHLAVLAAQRGNCVEGQLEDELVHREVFGELARMHGGVEPCPGPAQALIDYLAGLEGEMSLATLNVVAESWLDTVFHHLEKIDLAPSVFAAIEEDEARHTYGALQSARPDPDEVRPVVKELEKLLLEISASGTFMLPMAWFLGPAGVAEMGLSIARSHARACRHLQVEPDLRNMVISSRAARFLDRTAPKEFPANEWQRLKLENWKSNAPQLCFVDVPLDPAITNPAKLQAQMIHALGRILAREPHLRIVTRRDRLFQTDHPVVGLRSLYSDDHVITLYISRPERFRPRKIISLLNKQLKKIKSDPYEPYDGAIDIARDLAPLVPPNRCSVVVSYNGGYGGLYGTGPLSDMEGIPCSVTIGEPRWTMDPAPGTRHSEPIKPRFVTTVCVQMDHRVGDGRHVGLLAKSLTTEMPIVQREGL